MNYIILVIWNCMKQFRIKVQMCFKEKCKIKTLRVERWRSIVYNEALVTRHNVTNIVTNLFADSICKTVQSLAHRELGDILYIY